VIYGIGADLTDDGGRIDRESIWKPGMDVGFRMWNKAKRRQAPPSLVLLPE
jgi:hypothetical protein